MSALPIDTVISHLLATLRRSSNVVLSAPPGAGKTTRVPLALLELFPAAAGRIVMLEPRRIAATAAARYMAQALGEAVGQTVGYTVRFERKVSAATRIEVVTEGVLTRRLQEDPELSGVACVIFDEFHERSIHADLGLALCLECQAALRPDLKLLVMSATLDCGPLAALLGDAPLVASQGRSFPVAVRYLGGQQRQPLAQAMATAIRQALQEEQGDILAFLPGSAEIRAVQRELEAGQGVPALICPLYGDLPLAQQQQAILPGPQRRVVLATNIAETSLTIDGVRVVIDSGLTRRLQLDPASGLERLVTVRASKASALQRTGRAGRTAPGVCYRLYTEQRFQAMTPFAPPEIATADLAPLVLELAAWGADDPAGLAWLDPPPAAHLAAARELLQMLGALDQQNRISEPGRRMVRLPLHPRLARVLLAGQEQGLAGAACRLAAELSQRSNSPGLVRQVEQQLCRLLYCPVGAPGTLDEAGLAPLLLVGWPDRLAQRRSNDRDRYLLASGRGARLSAALKGGGPELLVALQVDGGSGAEGVIHRLVAVTDLQVRQALPQLVRRRRLVIWDEAGGRVAASKQEAVGALVLSSRQVTASDAEALPLVLEQIEHRGIAALNWTAAARQLQARVALCSRLLPEEEWPDLSEKLLGSRLADWLGPHLAGVRSWQEVQKIDLAQALQQLLDWRQLRELDSLVPLQVTIPSGRRAALDYTAEEGPVLAVKLQELFGLADSPTVCRGRLAVLVHLLSPAGRPVAVTRDLQGFWQRGYPEVRKELRGRYPKHPWPDDPWNAVATQRTKRALGSGHGRG